MKLTSRETFKVLPAVLEVDRLYIPSSRNFEAVDGLAVTETDDATTKTTATTLHLFQVKTDTHDQLSSREVSVKAVKDMCEPLKKVYTKLSIVLYLILLPEQFDKLMGSQATPLKASNLDHLQQIEGLTITVATPSARTS